MRRSTEKSAHGRGREADERPPAFRGWLSTDDDEIRRREWRGRTEIDEVRALDPEHHPFGDYRVASSSGGRYVVEIRSLRQRINSCECHDYRTNRLGTCKDVEGVLRRPDGVRSGGASIRRLNARIEIFLDERNGRAPRLIHPKGPMSCAPEVVAETDRLFRDLRRGSPKALDGLHRLALDHPGAVRVSRLLAGWVEARQASERKRRERARFAAALDEGRRSLDFLKRPLLPYQVEGVLHLAFGERALLADEMGLGKTVQAIAACALLRELRGVERVLVVSPASLKAEWEEQIATFSDLPANVVFGGPAARLLYALQLRAGGDGPAGTRRDAPARRRDPRRSPTHQELADQDRQRGQEARQPLRLCPYRHPPREPHRRSLLHRPVSESRSPRTAVPLQPGVLRVGRKGPARGLPQPGGVGGTGVVGDAPPAEGRRRESASGAHHEDFLRSHDRRPARRLRGLRAPRATARRHRRETAAYTRGIQVAPGEPRLHAHDLRHPYILDGKTRECPKMEEIEGLLPDLLEDPGRKIIIFSEWVRMLELVRDHAVEAGIEFAWHTGSVPQLRRRAEIQRFRKDPECRLFLSSESGGVGLNLQVADTVINLDQPWNPARLEQRIARAWRKHQTRHVNVIHLVSEHTIEHRMLGLLDAKRALAEGVLDRKGDLADIRMPNSRAAFMERLQAVLGPGPKGVEAAEPPATAIDRLRDALVAGHGATLQCILAREDADAALVVLDLPAARLAEEERRLSEETGLSVKVIDPGAYESMRHLAEAGLISMPAGDLREVYPAAGAEDGGSAGRMLRARALAERAEHKLKAAALLEGGGFAEEARIPAVEAARLAAGCLAVAAGVPEPEDAEAAAAYLLEHEVAAGSLSPQAVRILSGESPEAGAVSSVRGLLEAVDARLDSPTL